MSVKVSELKKQKNKTNKKTTLKGKKVDTRD